MEVKDGVETTELRLAAITIFSAVLTMLVSLGVISQSESEALNAVLGVSLPVLLVVIGNVSNAYTKSRTTVKEAAHKAASTS